MYLDSVERTILFVKKKLSTAEAGHDWFHVERVWKNAKLILEREAADSEIVELAALLHDIADSKFHGGDEEIGPRTAFDFLLTIGVSEEKAKHIRDIIKNMSFKAGLGKVSFASKEMEIVQDADRLDAIGAIGIARAFHFGGYKNNPLFDPQITPRLNQTKEEYKKSNGTTINHFYEKLLLLKNKMNTVTAKEIAYKRHQYMEGFLSQFLAEWEGRK